MSVKQKSKRVEITIPDKLYQWLLKEAQNRTQDISTVIQTALEQYVRQFDLTQTQTWQLCGTFMIAEPEEKYIVDSEEKTGKPITNYAEHVDDVLYKGD